MLVFCIIIVAYVLVWISSRFSKHVSKYSRKDHLRFAFGIAFITVGFLHILIPTFFSHLFLPIFSSPLEIINIAGFVQLVCGVSLLIRRVYREAAILLIVLLALFIPLSVLMLTHYIPGPLGPEYEPILGYLRILVFPLLIWIIIQICDLSPRRKFKNSRFNQDI